MKKNINKILVIRFSSIGDIVLTSPVVRCLKQQLKDAQVHFCTKEQYLSLVDQNPHIDKVHLLKDSLAKLIKDLKAENFVYVIDLHDNIRTLQIKIRLGVRSKTYNKLRIQRQLIASFRLPLPKPNHVVKRYFEVVESLGVTYDGAGLDFYIRDRDHVEFDWLPENFQKGYIAFVIGGTAFTKMLPVKKMIELCDKINQSIVLIGDKADAENGEIIYNFFHNSNSGKHLDDGLKALNKKTQIFNGCGKFNIGQSAYLVKYAKAVFSHDTGFAHIAAAFKKNVFSIWGGTVPLYFYPFETQFTLLENKKLSCRPCSKNGRRSCPKKHFKCMNENPLDFFLP